MDRSRRIARSPGYTLVEVLVTVAIVVVIAVIAAPVIARDRAADRADRADAELKALTDALDAFSEDVGEWPASLSQLITPLVAGDQDICGGNYNGGERGSWAGPYISRPPGGSGLPAGVGAVSTTFGLTDGGDIDYLVLTLSAVEETDAIALDARIDGDEDPATGTVRWTAAGSGQVTVRWMVPIPAC